MILLGNREQRYIKNSQSGYRLRAQDLCESRGGRPWTPVPKKPDDFCGCKHHERKRWPYQEPSGHQRSEPRPWRRQRTEKDPPFGSHTSIRPPCSTVRRPLRLSQTWRNGDHDIIGKRGTGAAFLRSHVGKDTLLQRVTALTPVIQTWRMNCIHDIKVEMKHQDVLLFFLFLF